MTALQNDSYTIISTLAIPNVMLVKLNSLNIVEVEWNDKLEEIQKTHIIQLKNLVKEIGNGEKMLTYIDTYSLTAITNEARKYAASQESNSFNLATAVLIDTLAKKLLFNFYLKFENPISPTKGFTNKEAAFDWLKKLAF